MNPTTLDIALAGRTEHYTFNKHARQSDGAVWLQEGETILLATVTCDHEPVSEDFLPLTVQYMEKSYAAGKIPGGFFKREAKPSDFETLTSRIVDRTIRPLFPKGFYYPVLVAVTVLSCDEEADLQRLAVLAAQAALTVSSLPVEKPVCAARVALLADEPILNPTLSQLERSTLDLFVCGTHEELLMIEMQGLWPTKGQAQKDPQSEIDEADLLEYIGLAQRHITEAAGRYGDAFKPLSKTRTDWALKDEALQGELIERVERDYGAAIEATLEQMAKSERGGALKAIAAKALEAYGGEDQVDPKALKEAIERIKRDRVRRQILDQAKRADGRSLDEIRPISIETNPLPCAHGACLFTRGETQALVVTTLGGDNDRQSQERLTDKNQTQERLMLHYNFPGYSVGEARRIGPPGRRELGHGNLAKRAIEAMVDPAYENSIRIVSEILESNGSSSMATVCGASMALKGAAVPMRRLVAGVAMGLVLEGDRHAVLTDITGLEDHDGDMDFKVAGSSAGITALQMDIKLGGIELSLLKSALEKAKAARLNILGQMEAACEHIVINRKGLPVVEFFKIDPKSVVDVIGKAGATIRDLIERFDVTIDLERESGGVKVRGTDADRLADAVSEIQRIAASGGGQRRRENTISSYQPGQELPAKVVKVADFGLFAELPDGSSGLVHISKIGADGRRIRTLSDHFSEGDAITAIFEGQDDRKKIALNIKEKVQ